MRFAVFIRAERDGARRSLCNNRRRWFHLEGTTETNMFEILDGLAKPIGLNRWVATGGCTALCAAADGHRTTNSHAGGVWRSKAVLRKWGYGLNNNMPDPGIRATHTLWQDRPPAPERNRCCEGPVYPTCGSRLEPSRQANRRQKNERRHAISFSCVDEAMVFDLPWSSRAAQTCLNIAADRKWTVARQ